MFSTSLLNSLYLCKNKYEEFLINIIMRTKEEKLEYARQYRLKNKEKMKQYRIDNAEKIRQSRIEYDNKHKEIIKEQHKRYKLKHKEKISEYQKQYFENNKDKIKQCPSNSFENRKIIDKTYRMNNQNKIKDYKLRKKYGISLDEYNIMFDKQNGKCHICNTHQDDLHKKLVVDHDHCTGNIRGLLCDKCNRGLGHFNDDIEMLQRAIDYLKNNG